MRKLIILFYLLSIVKIAYSDNQGERDTLAIILKQTQRVKLPVSGNFEKLDKKGFQLPNLFMSFYVYKFNPTFHDSFKISNSKVRIYNSCFYFKYKDKKFWVIQYTIKDVPLFASYMDVSVIALDSLNNMLDIIQLCNISSLKTKYKIGLNNQNKLQFYCKNKEDCFIFDEKRQKFKYLNDSEED